VVIFRHTITFLQELFILDDNTLTLSENEEMYLISVAELVEAQELAIVPISSLAEALAINAASANQMIRKLEELQLVRYQPYKGVTLTEQGRAIALRRIRNRRLWEVFLVQHLELPLDKAETLACGFEHLTDEAVCAQLAKYLENPVFDPHGQLIPDCQQTQPSDNGWFALTEAQIGDRLLVRQMKSDAATRSFLAAEGLYPGAVISLIAKGNSFLLQLKEKRFMIDHETAAQILVRRINNNQEDTPQ
jgi:DtxR family transcriptional regulator, Mn-dependent transcriptional regulator